MRKKGFTMMELVVVIMIIGVLALLSFPLVQRYLDNSQEIVCASNRKTLLRELENQSILDQKTSRQEIESIFSDLVKDKTICPKGGTISISFNADGNYTLSCSEHDQLDIDTAVENIQNIVLKNLGTINRVISANGTTQSLIDYFLAGNLRTIDSEAFSAQNKLPQSWPEVLRDEFGLTLNQSFSLQMAKDQQSFTLAITDKKITSDDIGSTIAVRVYTFDRDGNLVGTYVNKETQVIEYNGTLKYPCIDLTSMK